MKTLVQISFFARRGYLYAEVFQQSEPFVTTGQVTTRLPIRSALFKQRTGGLVVRVTTSQSPLLYVFRIFWNSHSGTVISTGYSCRQGPPLLPTLPCMTFGTRHHVSDPIGMSALTLRFLWLGRDSRTWILKLGFWCKWCYSSSPRERSINKKGMYNSATGVL